MPRDLPHFHLRNLGKGQAFKAKPGGSNKRPGDVADRAAHARALLRALDSLPDLSRDNLDGLYLEISGRANEPLKRSSLDSSGLTLLRYDTSSDDGVETQSATVFATSKGIEKLQKKIEQFRDEDTADKVREDGTVVPGRPKNADLVQSVGAITEAGLRALWRSPPGQFPPDGLAVSWEIWLDPEQAERFILGAPGLGVTIGASQLRFPEDVVVVANGTRNALATAVRRLTGVRALAVSVVTADFFDGLDVVEQAQWVDDLAQRTTFPANPNPGYVSLLDTGVSRAHPLIRPALDIGDRHAADPAWGTDDVKGHGTQMAGLALYGDMTHELQLVAPVQVTHRLESVKLIPDAGHNPHELLGVITRNAINAVEVNHPRRRTFTMASTTEDDTPHDGAPTSWSSEIDQLTAGVSGDRREPRLLLVSAGNTDNSTFNNGNYLDRCDHEDNEIESPAQAWNAICVGAYTEKTQLPPGETGVALAPFGDLSPSSRTATWKSHWPIKPDVVLEGGNWVAGPMPPPMRHGPLSLLSTDRRYPIRSFSFMHDTSAATALGAKCITELWSEYPSFWPETVRGLFVSSARWTAQMKSHLPPAPSKGSYAVLFRRYGYGVPDLARAKRSASNALTLVIEDTITPYALSPKTGSPIHNEMKLFGLPWPVEALRALNNAQVTLRVTLSTFISPNPSEPARGSKFGYASHNLRFKLNKADESLEQFTARISAAAEKPDGPESEADDGWEFGRNRRDVGSLHVDQLTCSASDLARRNLIAVHPVTGWWKSKTQLGENPPRARFSLIVEIDAGELDIDLYTEVQAEVAAMVAANNVIVV